MQLGQRVKAKLRTSVCIVGEIGVICEVYKRGNGPDGVSVIFEGGRYDGFSPEEQTLMLEPLDSFCQFASNYVYKNVFQVSRDWQNLKFTFR